MFTILAADEELDRRLGQTQEQDIKDQAVRRQRAIRDPQSAVASR